MTKQAEKAMEKRLEKARSDIEKAREKWRRGQICKCDFILCVVEIISHERNVYARRELTNEIDI